MLVGCGWGDEAGFYIPGDEAVVAGEWVEFAAAVEVEAAIADVGPPGLILGGNKEDDRCSTHLGGAEAFLRGLLDGRMSRMKTATQPIVGSIIRCSLREDLLNGLGGDRSGHFSRLMAAHAITHDEDLA